MLVRGRERISFYENNTASGTSVANIFTFMLAYQRHRTCPNAPIALFSIRLSMKRVPAILAESRPASAVESASKNDRTLDGPPHTGSPQSVSQLEAEVALYRQALEQARQDMQAFAYSVSHDLRAPLRAIEGFSRILLDDFSSELKPDAAKFLQHIVSNTQQLGNLIEDLLRLYRSTKNPPNRSSIDANAVCKEVVEDLQLGLNGKIVIQQNELPEVYADVIQLRQIFRELLANAIKFSRTKPSPRIEISAHKELGAVTFVIQDNGDGFDPKATKRLFQVFQKLHTGYPGNGVGLAIVKRMVEAHGGCVSASGAVDSGATFSFSLPGQNGTVAPEVCASELALPK
jgi:signal transduction histidine kinase